MTPPIEHDIAELKVPKDVSTVNIPPDAKGVTVDSEDGYFIVRYLVPTFEEWVRIQNNDNKNND